MKKAEMMFTTLVAVFILVLGALVLFKYAGDLKSILTEDADIETCRLSVLAQSQMKALGKSVVPLDCPRRNLKIYSNKVEINGKKSSKYEFKEISTEDINFIFAEELRSCWYKMTEGNRDIFENSIFYGVDNTCLICSEIEFNDNLKGKTFLGLSLYLKSTKIPKTAVSYQDYLERPQRNLYLLNQIPWTQYLPWGIGTTGRIFEDKISSDDKYLVYFLAYKPAAFAETTKALSIAYYIGLYKENGLKDQCSILVN